MDKPIRIYLYTALIFGIIGLVDSTAAQVLQLPALYFTILSVLLFLFFIVNIAALVLFFNKKLPGLFLILPVYHIIIFLFFLTISWLIKVEIVLKMSITIGILTSLFETIFSIYLLNRLNKWLHLFQSFYSQQIQAIC